MQHNKYLSFEQNYKLKAEMGKLKQQKFKQ